MKTETKTVTEIIVEKEEVLTTIVNVFKDMIGDKDTDEYMSVTHAREFIDAVDYLYEGTLKELLCEGYTMTLMPCNVFDKIEEFFSIMRKHTSLKQELYLVIMDGDKEHERIHMDYLSY